MEAATAPGSGLLTRDGAIPAIAPAPRPPAQPQAEPIDGVAQCLACERFPLVGENVYRHESSGGRTGGWICESCEEHGAGAGAGPASARMRVRTLGGAMNVRRLI